MADVAEGVGELPNKPYVISFFRNNDEGDRGPERKSLIGPARRGLGR